MRSTQVWLRTGICVILALAFALAFNAKVASAQNPTGQVALVVTGALNVRSGPTAEFTILGVLGYGAKVQILGKSTDGGWLLVDTEFGQGWISTSFVLVFNYTPPPAPTVKGPNELDQPVTGRVYTGNLYVRNGPAFIYTPLGIITSGTQISIIGQTTGWWYAVTPIGTGWVTKAFIKVTGITTKVPFIDPGNAPTGTIGAVG